MAQIVFTSPAGMVAMGMGYHGSVHGFPGIYIEFALRAKKPFVCKLNKSIHIIARANGKKQDNFFNKKITSQIVHDTKQPSKSTRVSIYFGCIVLFCGS